jgi:DNA-binding protein H-NS
MKFGDFNSIPLDRLWALQEKVCAESSRKITEEKARIEQRLSEFDQRELGGRTRRPYPPVFPKFDPTQPAETWAARRKCPRWLAAQLTEISNAPGI